MAGPMIRWVTLNTHDPTHVMTHEHNDPTHVVTLNTHDPTHRTLSAKNSLINLVRRRLLN